ERGIIVRQGVVPLRRALPDMLSSNTAALSPRMVNLIAELVQDWRRLDERIAAVSAENEGLAGQDGGWRAAGAGGRPLILRDGAGDRPDYLECRGGGDRQWCRLHAGTRLRRLAGTRTEAGVHRRSHDPGQDL